MGYEIAGGLGVKLARPDREVFVMVGDGSYLMMNSEIATSVMLGQKLDRRRARQPRLRLHQPAAAGDAAARSFNNLLADARPRGAARIDFAAHARSLGARRREGRRRSPSSRRRSSAPRRRTGPTSIVIDTDPMPTTEAGGAWWDVAVPEVSERPQVREAREGYEKARAAQAVG